MTHWSMTPQSLRIVTGGLSEGGVGQILGSVGWSGLQVQLGGTPFPTLTSRIVSNRVKTSVDAMIWPTVFWRYKGHGAG